MTDEVGTRIVEVSTRFKSRTHASTTIAVDSHHATGMNTPPQSPQQVAGRPPFALTCPRAPRRRPRSDGTRWLESRTDPRHQVMRPECKGCAECQLLDCDVVGDICRKTEEPDTANKMNRMLTR